MFILPVVLFSAVAAVALPTEVEPRATCYDYIIISTRGTGEAQGPSEGFISMIQQTLAAVPNGIEYDTVYPAADDQISTAAVTDIQREINAGLASCPSQQYALLGYSQGAAATTDTLKLISTTSSAGAAIKAVFLIGNPERVPGKKANVDEYGGNLTYSAIGLESTGTVANPGIPSAWDATGKVLDVCYEEDGVCGGDGAVGITAAHLLYGSTASVQTLGFNLLKKQLA